MRVLSFAVGSSRYALAAVSLIEVLPLVELQPAPALPPEVAGLLNYRGQVVPVIDIPQMLLGVPCPPRLSSRTLLTRYVLPDGQERILGLRVERAREVRGMADASPAPSGLRTPPWLGQVALEHGAIIQMIQPAGLLTDAVRELLFPPLDSGPEATPAHADSAAD